jgi:hypothetical protein
MRQASASAATRDMGGRMVNRFKPRRAKPKSDDARQCEEHREALLDEALDESFPASDPPSITSPPAKRC